jgi:hypothetical protein
VNPHAAQIQVSYLPTWLRKREPSLAPVASVESSTVVMWNGWTPLTESHSGCTFAQTKSLVPEHFGQRAVVFMKGEGSAGHRRPAGQRLHARIPLDGREHNGEEQDSEELTLARSRASAASATARS